MPRSKDERWHLWVRLHDGAETVACVMIDDPVRGPTYSVLGSSEPFSEDDRYGELNTLVVLGKVAGRVRRRPRRKNDRLVALCRKFIVDRRITCPEAVYQSDRVIEGAYEFIEKVCEVVGFCPDNDE